MDVRRRHRAVRLLFGAALVVACSRTTPRPIGEGRPVAPSPPAPPATSSVPDASDSVEERDAGAPDEDASLAHAAPPPFRPEDVGPIAPSGSARANDGSWTPVSLPNEGDEGAVLHRTLLHPDAARASADLYVVAIDLRRVGLRAVAGVSEPTATTAAGRSAPRPGTIPSAAHGALLAAFNGGWRSEHGHYGMKADGVVLVPASDASCTVAGYDDDTVRIGPWKALAAGEPRMTFFRQTPACLVTGGVRHPGLAAEMTTNWGAAENGDPLIRRSALGVDAGGTVLYFGLGSSLTARALADGMRHAGAADVAELDVNWSYPKLLVFHATPAGALEASSLFPGFVFEKAEYVRKRSARDFFYLVRR